MYCTTLKKGLIPFFYNGLRDFAAKLKYYNKELITIHSISKNYINYKEEHYREGMSYILKNKEQNEIEKISKRNLELINKLSEV